MAVPVGAAIAAAKPFAPKVLTMVGPIARKQAVKAATTFAGNRKCRSRAHDMAYERNGRYGQVTFGDGVRRWVVAAGDDDVWCFPALEDPSREHLRDQLIGVDLAKCLRVPEQQLDDEQRSLKTA